MLAKVMAISHTGLGPSKQSGLQISEMADGYLTPGRVCQ